MSSHWVLILLTTPSTNDSVFKSKKVCVEMYRSCHGYQFRSSKLSLFQAHRHIESVKSCFIRYPTSSFICLKKRILNFKNNIFNSYLKLREDFNTYVREAETETEQIKNR